jgi:hypothetical protein
MTVAAFDDPGNAQAAETGTRPADAAAVENTADRAAATAAVVEPAVAAVRESWARQEQAALASFATTDLVPARPGYSAAPPSSAEPTSQLAAMDLQAAEAPSMDLMDRLTPQEAAELTRQLENGYDAAQLAARRSYGEPDWATRRETAQELDRTSTEAMDETQRQGFRDADEPVEEWQDRVTTQAEQWEQAELLDTDRDAELEAGA